MVKELKIRTCANKDCSIEFEGRYSYCRLCGNAMVRKWKIKNKEKITAGQVKYRIEHKEEIILARKERKVKFPNYSKESYQRNKNNILQSNKNWRDKNNYIQSSLPNKSDRARKKREKSKVDPAFRLRNYVSKSIYAMLKMSGNKKGKKSILNYLSYSFDELKLHIETLFAPWMNWQNQGVYSSKIWNDNDRSTWKWQLDHIIPHSTFKYESMECKEFRECWALSNLRPLAAKQNYLEGISRIRHKNYLYKSI